MCQGSACGIIFRSFQVFSEPASFYGHAWWLAAEAETPILWPPDAKNWLIGKDPDAGKDWRQEGKGTTEDKMVRCHNQLNGHIREAWHASVHGVAKSQTRMSDWTEPGDLLSSLENKIEFNFLIFKCLASKRRKRKSEGKNLKLPLNPPKAASTQWRLQQS